MSLIPANTTRTKPYVMVLGQPDEPTREYLKQLGTGVRFVEYESELRQSDFDFIMSFASDASPLQLEGNAAVLHFSAADEGGYERIAELGPFAQDLMRGALTLHRYSINRVPGSKAADFDLAANPDGETDFRSIINDTVLPNLYQGGDHNVLDVSVDPNSKGSAYTVLPLLKERNGGTIAAIVETSEYVPVWCLPAETTDHLRWVKFFLDTMKRQRHDAFPPEEVGLSDDYRTTAELAVQKIIREHVNETARLVEQRERELLALQAQLEQAERRAETTDRMLLTSQHGPLVERVADTLRTFGFQVEDRDVHAEQHKTSKMEDLRITYPDATIGDGQERLWVALAEVKGYTGGAKANDLGQIERAVRNYIRDHSTLPDAQWYVVNAQIKQAPQLRPLPLASNPEMVAMFADNDGLVLDTRYLFRLKQLVDSGQITDRDAANMLMNQTGRFTLTGSIPGEEGTP